MSDKSRDAEPEGQEFVSEDASAPDADEIVADEDALAAAEADAMAADEDVTLVGAESEDEIIAGLEHEFDDEDLAAAPVIARKTAKAPVRKSAPTRKRNAALAEGEDPYAAHNPAEFVRQSAGELKKVVWPTWPQLVTMFGAVLVFVLIMIFFVGVLDMAFGWSLLQIFGSNA
ncbi:preprotein translocase subunit SecE [Tessaracoccus sp. Z1128]